MAKQLTSVFNEVAKQLSLEALSKLKCLPGINSMNVYQSTMHAFHRYWARPFVWRYLVRGADAQCHVRCLTIDLDCDDGSACKPGGV